MRSLSNKSLGVGIGLRRPFYDEILETRRRVDWLEITPENWMRRGGVRARQLDATAEQFTLVPHSVSLSIGGPDPLDVAFLNEISKLCKRVRAPFWSDHLCYSSTGGMQFHDLFPLPFTGEAVKHVVQRVHEVKRRVRFPFALENPTFYCMMPGAEMDEPTFLSEVVERADCGILLDVNNIYVNSLNLGIDPHHYLATVPLERIMQVHIAGHTRKGDVVVDTHVGPIIEPVWQLYQELLARTGPLPTLVEWDEKIPSMDAVINEADRARALWMKA
jgi:uncharacterized protein (UPF0276 family)